MIFFVFEKIKILFSGYDMAEWFYVDCRRLKVNFRVSKTNDDLFLYLFED